MRERILGYYNCVVLLVLLFTSQMAHAQWKHSVYFTSGEATIIPKSKEQISEFIFARDISLIDSVYVLGFTDSTGLHKQNNRLAKKRTLRTVKYLRPLFSDTLHLVYKAIGEESERSNPGMNHRRVEVILYSKEAVPVVMEPEEPIDTLSKGCFRRDDEFMANCQWIYSTKASVKTVKIVLEPHLYQENLEIFTLSTRSKNPKQVRWHKENTGKLWWKHERWFAEVRKTDVEAFGLLSKVSNRLDSTECYVCTNTPIKSIDTEIRVVSDVAIMQHLQIRRRFLDKEVILIVPEEFVRKDRSYFADSERTFAIQWYAKRGRRNFPYYFAKVPEQLVTAELWSVLSYQAICETKLTNIGPKYGVQQTKPHRTNFESVVGFVPLTFGLSFHTNIDSAFHAQIGGFVIKHIGNREMQLLADYQPRQQLSFQVDYRQFFWVHTLFNEYAVAHTNRPVVDDFQRSVGMYGGVNVRSEWNNELNFKSAIYGGIQYHHNAFYFGLDRVYLEFGPGYNLSTSSFFVWNRFGLLWRI